MQWNIQGKQMDYLLGIDILDTSRIHQEHLNISEEKSIKATYIVKELKTRNLSTRKPVCLIRILRNSQPH